MHSFSMLFGDDVLPANHKDEINVEEDPFAWVMHEPRNKRSCFSHDIMDTFNCLEVRVEGPQSTGFFKFLIATGANVFRCTSSRLERRGCVFPSMIFKWRFSIDFNWRPLNFTQTRWRSCRRLSSSASTNRRYVVPLFSYLSHTKTIHWRRASVSVLQTVWETL
ncbi:unnamed protein product [Vicia faba]|uniref:Uncharacterized protein n=1 Tax=Vicia faba TaxID=3906 RepID=A0AAV1A8N1_VICFA|nr:unnamed protein product [Vicia faba]